MNEWSEWMNEWTNEWMNDWMIERMNERTNQRTNEGTNERSDERMNERTNERMNERMNDPMNERRKERKKERKKEWKNEWMNCSTQAWKMDRSMIFGLHCVPRPLDQNKTMFLVKEDKHISPEDLPNAPLTCNFYTSSHLSQGRRLYSMIEK